MQQDTPPSMPYCHILLVDDNRRFRKEIAESLEEFNVIQASTGEEALRILMQPNEIELVILDVMMPGLNGIEVLKQMKQSAPDLGIIILTGYSSKDVAIQALKGHADDYLEKPFKVHELKASIERLVKKKKGLGSGNGEGIKGKVKRVRHFLEKNYDKKVNLKMAADLVCLSPKYVSKIFKEHAGVGFNEYRQRVKVEMAKVLLEKSGENINQMAAKLGYENTESFIKSFKKHTGLTPASYRKKGITFPEATE